MIGIYAGTFDPVHSGHIAFARAAMRACALDEVVFAPEPMPWRKQAVTDIAHRAKMLEIATATEQGMRVARLRPAQCTVADTLPELRRWSEGSELVFLLGSDVARYMHTWEGVQTLLGEVTLAVGLRSGDTVQQMRRIMQQLELTSRTPIRYRLINASYAGLTSSRIRHDINQAALHPEIAAYIRKHNLYSRTQETGRHSA